MTRNLPLIAIAALLLTACASSLKVTEISNDTPIGTAVDGIPFRVLRPYTAKLYKLNDGKSSYVLATSTPSVSFTMPDMRHLYVLGFEGQPLSNPTVNLTLNPDDTINTVSLSSSPSGQAALTAVGAQITAVGGALTANQTAKTTAQTAYASARTAYYTAMQSYCKASTAQPLDPNAVRAAAAGVYASEITFLQARDAAQASDAAPFPRVIDPQNDVGLGCAAA